jgi:hypothetical protein
VVSRCCVWNWIAWSRLDCVGLGSGGGSGSDSRWILDIYAAFGVMEGKKR